MTWGRVNKPPRRGNRAQRERFRIGSIGRRRALPLPSCQGARSNTSPWFLFLRACLPERSSSPSLHGGSLLTPCDSQEPFSNSAALSYLQCEVEHKRQTVHISLCFYCRLQDAENKG